MQTRTKKNGVKTVQIGLMIRAETYEKLRKLAKEQNVSITFLVDKILTIEFSKKPEAVK